MDVSGCLAADEPYGVATSESVREAYAARVAAGEIVQDAGQLALAEVLDGVRTALEADRPRGWRRAFRRLPEPVAGVYVWGGVGTGKSMLMDVFHARTRIGAKRRVHFHAFMQEVHAGLHAARAARTDDAIAPVARDLVAGTRLLCLDEMTIGDIVDAMIVGRLFEALFAQGVTVVTTSNRPPDDLYEDGLQRDRFLPFIALLKERLAVHHLASEMDYRRAMLAGADVYFTPADGEARGRIEAIWRELAGGEGTALSLTVKGREVVLPAYRNGVGRARFWDLCGRALGPADHLAIAEAVRVLILEDIPRLSRANFNEAKRFVTLIDTLYEARVRLIASAAAPPESLYLEGEGAVDFARTASRLREMQSRDWGVSAVDG